MEGNPPAESEVGIPSRWGQDAPAELQITDRCGGNVSCPPVGRAASQCRQKGDAGEAAGRGLAVPGHCSSSVLGPVANGGASGRTLALLPRGPGTAPLCFCCSFRCARRPQGNWIWGPVSGHPSQIGVPQKQQLPFSLAAAAGCGCRLPWGSPDPLLAAGGSEPLVSQFQGSPRSCRLPVLPWLCSRLCRQPELSVARQGSGIGRGRV